MKTWSKLFSTFVGILCVLGVITSWVAESEIIQSMQASSSGSYNKPFFLSWIVNVGFITFLPVWALIQYIQCQKDQTKKFIGRAEKRITLVALASFIPSTLMGWTWNYSLAHTSVSGNTIIYDSSFIWIFVFSIFALHEKVSLTKVLSLLMSGGGMVIVTLSGQNTEESGIDQTTGGYLCVIASTLLYAFFTVFFLRYAAHEEEKTEIPEPIETIDPIALIFEDQTEDSKKTSPKKVITSMDTLFFLAMSGIFMVFLTWPLILILDWTGVEPFEMPGSLEWEEIGINIVLNAVVNLLILIGMSWTSALFISTGCLLSMPLSVVTDMIIHDYILPAVAFAGMFYILLGFILLTLSDLMIDFREKGKLSSMPQSLWKSTIELLSRHWSLFSSSSSSSTPSINS